MNAIFALQISVLQLIALLIASSLLTLNLGTNRILMRKMMILEAQGRQDLHLLHLQNLQTQLRRQLLRSSNHILRDFQVMNTNLALMLLHPTAMALMVRHITIAVSTGQI